MSARLSQKKRKWRKRRVLRLLKLLLSTTMDEGVISDILDDYAREAANAR